MFWVAFSSFLLLAFLSIRQAPSLPSVYPLGSLRLKSGVAVGADHVVFVYGDLNSLSRRLISAALLCNFSSAVITFVPCRSAIAR